MAKYFYQLKLGPDSSRPGAYTEPQGISGVSEDAEAICEAQKIFNKRTEVGRFVKGFRVLKVIHQKKKSEKGEEKCL